MTDKQLGRYQLLGVLGKGAMGIVYEAFDPHLDRRVAIKTMRISDTSSEQSMSYEGRFLTEARSSARLRHPAIVSVYDWGRDDDVTYLVMEKIKGVNLRQCLDKGVRFSAEGAVTIMRQVLGALAHAHDQKVVHRDIKPENILLDASGSVKLTDFGIAKIQDGADNGTLISGLVIGTPRYMSPEQVQGKEVDARSDLFSAGVLLYELLTGKPPFNGSHAMAVINSILSDAPLPLADSGVGLSPLWDGLVSKALAKQTDDRFQRAEAFLAALDHAAAHEPSLLDGAQGSGSDHPLVAMLQPGSPAVLVRLLSELADHPGSPSVAALPGVATEPSLRSAAKRVSLSPPAVSSSQQKAGASPIGRMVWVGVVVTGLSGAGWWFTRTTGVPAEPAEVATTPKSSGVDGAKAQSDRDSRSGAERVPALPTQTSVPAPMPLPAPLKPSDRVPPVVQTPAVAARGAVTEAVAPTNKTKIPSVDAGVSSPGAKSKDSPSAAPVVKPVSVQSAVAPASATANVNKCSRLLEKASSGEPLSDSEQKEMVSSCR